MRLSLSLLPILSNIFHSYKTKHIKYISSSKNINMSDEMAHSLRHDCVQSLGPQRPTFSQRTGESTRPYATSPFHGDMESIKEFTTSSACANGMSCSRWRPLHTTSGPTHPHHHPSAGLACESPRVTHAGATILLVHWLDPSEGLLVLPKGKP